MPQELRTRTSNLQRLMGSRTGEDQSSIKTLTSEPLIRVSSRNTDPLNAHLRTRVTSDARSEPPRRLLGRLAQRLTSSASAPPPPENHIVACGFLKRGTGMFHAAWWSDAISAQRGRSEPGNGWRPFKTLLVNDTLYFYKVPPAMVPEVRRIFQVRSTQWPTPCVAIEPDDSGESDDASTSNTDADAPATAWASAGKHPELVLTQSTAPPPRWAACIESGTPTALAHELVFATQRDAATVASGTREAQDADTKAFLHMVFYALGTSAVPWDTFVHALREQYTHSRRLAQRGSTYRVSLFVDLLLWKRPLLHTGHEAAFFAELDALATELARESARTHWLAQRQINVWREQWRSGTTVESLPTDWLSMRDMTAPMRADLAGLHTCWHTTALAAQNADEVAAQIHAFHLDRLYAFLCVPVTAYRLSSSVTEPLLRSFRFDAARPHWLTHVILRQLLVDDAPERQGGADRALVLAQWVRIGEALAALGDMAGWIAVAGALCSRAAALAEDAWRRLPAALRATVVDRWGSQLHALGWVDGVRVPVAALADGSVAYFGNAGLEHAATHPLSAPRPVNSRISVAAQEPEFNSARALAQKLSCVSPTQPTASAAPLLPYQALFQRLATHEFVLHTSVGDYLGSVVLVDGIIERGPSQGASKAQWPTETRTDVLAVLSLPAPFPVLLPGRSSAEAFLLRRGGESDNVRAFPSLREMARRAMTDDVLIGDVAFVADSKRVSPPPPPVPPPKAVAAAPPVYAAVGAPPALGAACRLSQDLLAIEPRASQEGRDPTPSTTLFHASVRAASAERAVDLMVLGASHLVVRAPDPLSDSSTYRVLHVAFDVHAFRDACLFGFRCWTTPAALLDALTQRWHAAEDASREMEQHARLQVANQFPTWTLGGSSDSGGGTSDPVDWDRVAAIRRGVLATLQHWIDTYPREWAADPALYDALHAFLVQAAAGESELVSDAPVLVEAMTALRAAHATLPVRVIGLAGGLVDTRGDGDALLPPTALSSHLRPPHLDTCTAHDLVVHLDALAAPTYAQLNKHDFAHAIACFEACDAPGTWRDACDAPDATTIYHVLRRLPPGAHFAHAPEHSHMHDVLRPTLRTLCELHEAVRDWARAAATEPRIGVVRRAARFAVLIDATLLCRARIAAALPHAGAADIRAPLPASFVEVALLDALTSGAVQAHRAAWAHLASQRGLTAWPDLLAHAPHNDLDAAVVPDVGWLLTWLAHFAARAKAQRSDARRLDLARFASAAALVDDALALRQPYAVGKLAVAAQRTAQLRAATHMWPAAMVTEDAAAEGAATERGASLCAALELARMQWRRDVAAFVSVVTSTVPEPAAPAASPAAPADMSVVQVEQAASLATSDSSTHASPGDLLLAAVPTQRAASTFACGGAQLSVWPYARHPFVLQLVAPSGQKLALKVPTYDAFCAWLAHLQAVENVRLADSFDPGTYAAEVAEGLGRTHATCVFGVPLTELSVRHSGLALPPAIERLLEEIETRGIHEQGIYRISGSRAAVEALQSALDTRPLQQCAIERVDVHAIASVVKLWLRELPEPLVPYALYGDMIQTECISDQVERVRAMRQVLASFPRSHARALQRLTMHLATVARASKQNLMAPHNIGLVFGSTLLNPPPGAHSVAEGLENLGKAAHIVKIMVVMHRELFKKEHVAKS